jgi:hypothetical protein
MPVIADNALALWEVTATAVHRTLIERDSTGARLLTERGPLARLRLTARPAMAPRFEISASLAQARLDYQGRTQTGAALDTISRHDEAGLGARWQPVPAAAWGVPSLSVDALRWRRAIAATASVSSLAETSTYVMPGVAWTSAPFSAAGATWTGEAQWRASVLHRLFVDYAGVFDTSSLRGGRRDEATLRLQAALPGGWRWSAEWRHARQAASGSFPLYRNGALAGSVRQPLLAIDDVALSISRSF